MGKVISLFYLFMLIIELLEDKRFPGHFIAELLVKKFFLGIVA